jgi:hypothetical protein
LGSQKLARRCDILSRFVGGAGLLVVADQALDGKRVFIVVFQSSDGFLELALRQQHRSLRAVEGKLDQSAAVGGGHGFQTLQRGERILHAAVMHGAAKALSGCVWRGRSKVLKGSKNKA